MPCYFLCWIYGLQAKAMPFNPATNKVDIQQQHSAPTYKKVLDQRKHAIRGLWVRCIEQKGLVRSLEFICHEERLRVS